MKETLLKNVKIWFSKQLWLAVLPMILASVPASAQVERVVAEAEGIT